MLAYEQVRSVRATGRRATRIVLAVSVAATLLLGIAWLLWQLRRERAILSCEAATFSELEEALGPPSEKLITNDSTCWRYDWAWGDAWWCGQDGRYVQRSPMMIL